MLYNQETLIFNEKFTSIPHQLINFRSIDWWYETNDDIFYEKFQSSENYTLFFVKYENDLERIKIETRYNNFIVNNVNFECSYKHNVICLLKKIE